MRCGLHANNRFDEAIETACCTMFLCAYAPAIPGLLVFDRLRVLLSDDLHRTRNTYSPQCIAPQWTLP